jgi:hypothetical protein
MALSLATVQATVTAANIANRQVTAVRPGKRRTITSGTAFSVAAGSLSYTGTARIIGGNLVLFSAYFAPLGNAADYPPDTPIRVDLPASPSGTVIVPEHKLEDLDQYGMPVHVICHARDVGGHIADTDAAYNWPADPVDPTISGAAAALATALTDWQPGGALTVHPFTNPVTAMTLDMASLTSIAQSTLAAHALDVAEVGSGIYS